MTIPHHRFAAVLTAVIPFVFVGVRTAHAQRAPLTSICYQLTYDDTTGASLAQYVALDQNAEHEARSGIGPGAPRHFWKMFLVGATWERSHDTLQIHFTNGFSSVDYTLRGLPARVHHGIAQFHYDVVGGPVPTVRVTAIPIRCATARLQSPEVTSKDREERRATEERRRFVETETARVAAEPSPLVGTYRFELVLPGVARPIVVFARTAPMPHAAFWQLTGNDAYLPALGKLTPALGYSVRLSVAMDSAASSLAKGQLAYFDVVSKPNRAADGRTHWRGLTDVLFAVSRLVSDGPLDSLLSQASGAVSAVWFDEARGETVGGWTAGPDDRIEFTMRVRRAGQNVLSMRGMRISRVTAEVKE